MKKGNFNSPAHVEEVQSILDGKGRDFFLVSVPLSNAGLLQTGNQQGEFEIEGNGIFAPGTYLTKDYTKLTQEHTIVGASPLYIRFNHPDQPWLPIGIPRAPVKGRSANIIPCGYVLTFGRFWIYVKTAIPGASQDLLVSKASMCYSISQGNTIPAEAYQAPTWAGIRS